jgi:hypothetical protein
MHNDWMDRVHPGKIVVVEGREESLHGPREKEEFN